MSQLMSHIQDELKSTLEGKGLIDTEGEPKDEGSIVVESKAASSNRASTSEPRQPRKSKKSRKSKKPVQTLQPTDELIHLKQEVVKSLNEQVKAGVHLNHVPLPDGEEYDRSPRSHEDTESESESGSDYEAHQHQDKILQAHMPPEDETPSDPSHKIRDAVDKCKSDRQRNEQLNRDPSDLNQRLENVHQRLDDLKKRETTLVRRQETLSRETLGSPSRDPTIFSIFFKIVSFIQILPLIVLCAFNTSLLYVISRTLDTYAAGISRVQKMMERFTPVIIMGVFNSFTKFLHGFNAHAINFIDEKKQQTEEFTQYVDEKSRTFGHDLVRDFRIVEESTQNYSPSLFRFRENLTMLVVVLVQGFLWISVPAFNILQNFGQEYSSKRKVPVA